MFVYGVTRYIGGLLIGISLGMFLTMRYIPEDDRKLLPSYFVWGGFACLLVGIFVSGVRWHKPSRTGGSLRKQL